MPFIKRSLTRAEDAVYLGRAEQLRASGVDIEIPEERRADACALDIVVARPPASLVCDLPRGGVYFVVRVRLHPLQSGLILPDCQITTHWDDQIVLESFDERNPVVDFGGQLHQQSEILNQRIENNLRLYRGQVIEGLVLASGLRPIPPEYRDGTIVPFQLTFTDQFDREFREQAELSVWRTTKRQNRALQSGCGLYDGAGQQQGPAEGNSRRELSESGGIMRGKNASPSSERKGLALPNPKVSGSGSCSRVQVTK
jgi:hypothetical protein